jgi:long-chain acyl-CoA synthetase
MGLSDPSGKVDVEALEARLAGPGGPFALGDIEADGGPITVYVKGATTLTDIYERARKLGGLNFLSCEGRSLTYSEFFSWADEWAHFITSNFNIRRGDKIGLLLHDPVATAVAFVAITSIGAAAVLPHGETESVTSSFDAAACRLVVAHAGSNEAGAPAAADWPAQHHQLLLPRWNVTAKTGRRCEPPSIGADDDAVVPFTSGTTGTPKGVLLTHRNVTTGLWNMMLAGSLANATRGATGPMQPRRTCSLLLSPMSHVSGYTQLLLMMIMGGRLVQRAARNAEAIARDIEKEKVTAVVGVSPSFIPELVDATNGLDVSSVVSLQVMGMALLPAMAQRLSSAFPNVVIGTSYGQTEIGGAICALNGEALRDRPGSSGRVVPTAQVRIVDDKGKDLATGKTGEILIRGAMVMRGYCGGQALARGDWLRSGDWGWLSDDRHLHLVSRGKDKVSISGKVVSISAVEQFLSEWMKIDDIAVFLPEQDASQLVAAIAISDRARDDKKFSDVRDQIGTDVSLMICAALPRTPSGKVDYRRLRQMAVEG